VSFRYESAFSLKPEERYTAGLGRKSSWDTMTDNTVEDISTSYSDSSSEKYVSTGSRVCELSHCAAAVSVSVIVIFIRLDWFDCSALDDARKYIQLYSPERQHTQHKRTNNK